MRQENDVTRTKLRIQKNANEKVLEICETLRIPQLRLSLAAVLMLQLHTQSSTDLSDSVLKSSMLLLYRTLAVTAPAAGTRGLHSRQVDFHSVRKGEDGLFIDASINTNCDSQISVLYDLNC